ncbi:MAG TPA: VOC family protein [Vicinamibacterales bacterium]|nr:VOC family protein [Vicinamibacterales bacterium]
MNRTALSFTVPALLALAAASHPSAQMLNKEAPVRVGHYHLNVTSIADHKKFWVDALGGTAGTVGSEEVVKFGDVMLFLHAQKPSGGTRTSTIDHIGLAAPDVPSLAKKVVSAGYQRTVGREGGAGPAAAPAGGQSAVYGNFEYLLGPDNVKVELVTAKGGPPIAHHHVHFINTQYVEMRDWYVKALDATPRTGPNTFTDYFAGADLPGIGYMLNFFRWEVKEPMAPTTAGRVIDHVGFEVRDLEAFCKKLEGKGIKLTQAYRKGSPLGASVATAMLVDPWGTVIELTEGLDKAL